MAGSDRRGDHHAVDGAEAARWGHGGAYNLCCCVAKYRCRVAYRQRTPLVVICGPLGDQESWDAGAEDYLCLQRDREELELEDELKWLYLECTRGAISQPRAQLLVGPFHSTMQ